MVRPRSLFQECIVSFAHVKGAAVPLRFLLNSSHTHASVQMLRNMLVVPKRNYEYFKECADSVDRTIISSIAEDSHLSGNDRCHVPYSGQAVDQAGAPADADKSVPATKRRLRATSKGHSQSMSLALMSSGRSKERNVFSTTVPNAGAKHRELASSELARRVSPKKKHQREVYEMQMSAIFKKLTARLRKLWADLETPDASSVAFMRQHFGTISVDNVTSITNEIHRHLQVKDKLVQLRKLVDQRERIIARLVVAVNTFENKNNGHAYYIPNPMLIDDAQKGDAPAAPEETSPSDVQRQFHTDVGLLRGVTAAVLLVMQQWRTALSDPCQRFVWKTLHYIAKMRTDLTFLRRSRIMGQCVGACSEGMLSSPLLYDFDAPEPATVPDLPQAISVILYADDASEGVSQAALSARGGPAAAPRSASAGGRSSAATRGTPAVARHNLSAAATAETSTSGRLSTTAASVRSRSLTHRHPIAAANGDGKAKPKPSKTGIAARKGLPRATAYHNQMVKAQAIWRNECAIDDLMNEGQHTEPPPFLEPAAGPASFETQLMGSSEDTDPALFPGSPVNGFSGAASGTADHRKFTADGLGPGFGPGGVPTWGPSAHTPQIRLTAGTQTEHSAAPDEGRPAAPGPGPFHEDEPPPVRTHAVIRPVDCLVTPAPHAPYPLIPPLPGTPPPPAPHLFLAAPASLPPPPALSPEQLQSPMKAITSLALADPVSTPPPEPPRPAPSAPPAPDARPSTAMVTMTLPADDAPAPVMGPGPSVAWPEAPGPADADAFSAEPTCGPAAPGLTGGAGDAPAPRPSSAQALRQATSAARPQRPTSAPLKRTNFVSQSLINDLSGTVTVSPVGVRNHKFSSPLETTLYCESLADSTLSAGDPPLSARNPPQGPCASPDPAIPPALPTASSSPSASITEGNIRVLGPNFKAGSVAEMHLVVEETEQWLKQMKALTSKGLVPAYLSDEAKGPTAGPSAPVPGIGSPDPAGHAPVPPPIAPAPMAPQAASGGPQPLGPAPAPPAPPPVVPQPAAAEPGPISPAAVDPSPTGPAMPPPTAISATAPSSCVAPAAPPMPPDARAPEEELLVADPRDALDAAPAAPAAAHVASDPRDAPSAAPAIAAGPSVRDGPPAPRGPRRFSSLASWRASKDVRSLQRVSFAIDAHVHAVQGRLTLKARRHEDALDALAHPPAWGSAGAADRPRVLHHPDDALPPPSAEATRIQAWWRGVCRRRAHPLPPPGTANLWPRLWSGSAAVPRWLRPHKRALESGRAGLEVAAIPIQHCVRRHWARRVCADLRAHEDRVFAANILRWHWLRCQRRQDLRRREAEAQAQRRAQQERQDHEAEAAAVLQRVGRGHVGRAHMLGPAARQRGRREDLEAKYGRRWRARVDARRAVRARRTSVNGERRLRRCAELCHWAGVTIQRVWRGHRVRRQCAVQRPERVAQHRLTRAVTALQVAWRRARRRDALLPRRHSRWTQRRARRLRECQAHAAVRIQSLFRRIWAQRKAEYKRARLQKLKEKAHVGDLYRRQWPQVADHLPSPTAHESAMALLRLGACGARPTAYTSSSDSATDAVPRTDPQGLPGAGDRVPDPKPGPVHGQQRPGWDGSLRPLPGTAPGPAARAAPPRRLSAPHALPLPQAPAAPQPTPQASAAPQPTPQAPAAPPQRAAAVPEAGTAGAGLAPTVAHGPTTAAPPAPPPPPSPAPHGPPAASRSRAPGPCSAHGPRTARPAHDPDGAPPALTQTHAAAAGATEAGPGGEGPGCQPQADPQALGPLGASHQRTPRARPRHVEPAPGNAAHPQPQPRGFGALPNKHHRRRVGHKARDLRDHVRAVHPQFQFVQRPGSG